MKLRELLKDIEITALAADPDTEIGGVRYDSRAVEPGDLFVAVKVDTRYTSIPLFPKSTNADGSIVTVTLNRK